MGSNNKNASNPIFGSMGLIRIGDLFDPILKGGGWKNNLLKFECEILTLIKSRRTNWDLSRNRTIWCKVIKHANIRVQFKTSTYVASSYQNVGWSTWGNCLNIEHTDPMTMAPRKWIWKISELIPTPPLLEWSNFHCTASLTGNFLFDVLKLQEERVSTIMLQICSTQYMLKVPYYMSSNMMNLQRWHWLYGSLIN